MLTLSLLIIFFGIDLGFEDRMQGSLSRDFQTLPRRLQEGLFRVNSSCLKVDFKVAFRLFQAKILPLLQSKQKAQRSSGAILLLLSILRVRTKNSFETEPMFLVEMIDWIVSVSIFLSKSLSFLARHGVSLRSISKKMIPRAHMSDLKEY